jgi:hypothetical protein
LLVSAQPGAFHYPGVGTLLVSPDVVAVNGVFDGAGCFEQPIDLAKLDLAGQAVYVQALQMSKTESVSVSEGLSMRFAPGNRQPPLYYDGPPMTAIPCKAIDEYLDQTSYTVLLEFMVRQYSDVRVIDTFAVDDQTQAVVVKLISDRMVPQGTVPMPIAPPKPLRTVLDLGPFPPPVLEVWVAYPMWAPPEAEEPPAPNADGDGRGYIICYGPDVRGDVRQSIKAEAGPGGDARDRVPTDRCDSRLPPGWCIVHARAAVVDLRY